MQDSGTQISSNVQPWHPPMTLLAAGPLDLTHPADRGVGIGRLKGDVLRSTVHLRAVSKTSPYRSEGGSGSCPQMLHACCCYTRTSPKSPTGWYRYQIVGTRFRGPDLLLLCMFAKKKKAIRVLFRLLFRRLLDCFAKETKTNMGRTSETPDSAQEILCIVSSTRNTKSKPVYDGSGFFWFPRQTLCATLTLQATFGSRGLGGWAAGGSTSEWRKVQKTTKQPCDKLVYTPGK